MLAFKEMNTSPREQGFSLSKKESKAVAALEATPHLPKDQLLPINPDAIEEMVTKLAELVPQLTPQEKEAVERMYNKKVGSWSTAKAKVQDVLDQVKSVASFNLRKEKRAYAVASLLTMLSLVLAACAAGAEAGPLSSPVAVTGTSATTTENGVEQQATPTSEFPQDTQQLESAIASAEGVTQEQAEGFIEQHEGTGGGAGGLDPVFAEIHRNFEASGLTSQILDAQFVDLEGAEHDFVLFEIPDYQIEDTSQWVAFPSPVTGEGALFISLAGSNEEAANLDEIVVKWGTAANWLVGLNEDGRAVRTVTPRYGQYEEFPLYGQYTSGVPGVIALVDQMRTEQGAQITATPEQPETPDRVVIDMSQAVLERPIAPECKDQFPVVVDEGLAIVCFTFDNWVRGPIELNDGYEMIIGAEGWMEQNGQQIPVLIPLATANRERNEMQLHNYMTQEFAEYIYDSDEAFWQNHLRIEPGDSLYIALAMPNPQLADNSTDGFGFEAVEFTQEELNQVFQTGNFSILRNLVWPAIDIDARGQ